MDDDLTDLLDRGCYCSTTHPPCSFCTDGLQTEEEYEIYAQEGAQGVREHRSGVRVARIAQTEAMRSSAKYGRF